MCMAADKTIAQVSKITSPGEIDPEQVVTPGLFVDGVVEVRDPQQEEVLIRTGVEYA
jgi:3-oxoadipate CoA-transferase alpha subunit